MYEDCHRIGWYRTQEERTDLQPETLRDTLIVHLRARRRTRTFLREFQIHLRISELPIIQYAF